MSVGIVCITGGYGHLGQCLGRAFLDAGFTVMLTGRDEAKLRAAATALGCAAHRLDVTDAAQAALLAGHLDATYGRLDVLINNAALVRLDAIDTVDPAVFLEMLRTNIYGVFVCTQALLPVLRRAPAPLVINIGSTAGHRASPHMPAYNASKFGLIGLTGSLRAALRAERIRVTTLSPSAISFTDSPTGREVDRIRGEDVARAAVFLATGPAHALVPDFELWSTCAG